MSADNLANLLDAMTETSVYVIEENTHRLLYFNRRCRDTGRGKAALGIKCHEVWPEVCANCPLDALAGKDSSHIVCYDPLMKTTVDVTANRILWDGNIPAVVVMATPHRLNFEEEQGLLKIKQMYAQSLVTVFDECVIVNLTADYYVNCQKDFLWTDIPEQGNFSVENRKYAKKTLYPDDLEEFLNTFSREALLRLFGEGKKQFSKRLRRLCADGSYHMVEFTAAKIEQIQGNECWCALVYRDVQDAYLLEQQRNLEMSQLATAAQISSQMLIAVNLTQNTYHMLEYERFPVRKPGDSGSFDDLIAAELATVHPDYQAEFAHKFLRSALMESFAAGKHLVTMEIPHLGEDGAYHWFFTQVVWVESSYTDDLVEITLSRNIDEERRLQEELLEKERQAKQLLEEALQKAEKASSAKSDFLSKMSHDIRTPMNAIIGMTELAKLHVGDAEKLEDYLRKIETSSNHLLGLINDVLDVSKIESGTVKLEETEFDLRDLVRETAEMVRLPIEEKRQILTVDVEKNLYTRVLGDFRKVKQVLVNILENASKYTPDNGKIWFSVKESNGFYQFEISDTGIGMKPEYLEHIFEPFSRAGDSRINKVLGTGLGMTIVKNLVSILGGYIQVESEYQKGSRFLVSLFFNKCSAESEKSPNPEEKPELALPDLCVLLVEDNELNRQIATEMLTLLGLRVECADNGRQAVDLFCSRPPYYYGVVLMDIQMPVLNGYEAAKQIRASDIAGSGEIPIIAMTADAFAEDVKLAYMAGMDEHLAKPISMNQLKQTISGCLAEKKNRRI